MMKNVFTNSYKVMEWDTKFFGYKVAKAEVKNLNLNRFNKLLKKLSVNKVKLIYYFVEPKDKVSINTAMQNGGYLVDEKVTYSRSIPRKKRFLKDEKILSYFKKPLNNQLKFLSLEAGIYSRYKVDPNFKNGEFEKLYKDWVKKSLSGEIAKDILVYRIGKKEVGFIALKDENGKCNISLIAIDPKYRRKGIGKKLMNAAFGKAIEWGCKEMLIMTQKANINGCKFYEDCGFEIKSIVNVYHLWLNG
jgi:dTDP-4-amino-4,6-dideoxy-D-galactose acyltransferase